MLGVNGSYRKLTGLQPEKLTDNRLMKKILSLAMAMLGLLPTAMFAGDNDLLWDYTENAPGSSPDHGLYYASKVSDAAGTNNGLKGIKLRICLFR